MQDVDPRAVSRHVRSLGPVFGRVLLFDGLGSTQDMAIRIARSGAPEGSLVIARHQTAGRGRQGRSWFSPAGAGLYASFVVRPPAPPEHWPVLSVLAGVGLVESLVRAGIADARVKWPNDCVVGGRKLAGILADAEPDGGFAVVGVGINACFEGRKVPADLADRVTALDSLLPPGTDIALACARALYDMATTYARSLPDLAVEPGRVAPLLWTHGEARVGDVTGRVTGVTPRGELALTLADGRSVNLSAGEVADAGGG